MEPRKMVLIFAEQQWRHKHGEQTCEHSWGEKERVGGLDRVTRKHTLPYVK